jgi:hypothetical protein
MTSARFGPATVLLANGKVLVAGGSPDSSDARLSSAEIYDPATGTWTPTGSMTVPRSPVLVLLADGRALAVGGANDPDLRPASAEVYDPVSGAWASTGQLSTRATYGALGLLDGTVLAVAEAVPPQVYDRVQGVWTPSAPAGIGGVRILTSLVRLADGRVLAAGGLSRDFPAPQRRAAIFDPAAAAGLQDAGWAVGTNR